MKRIDVDLKYGWKLFRSVKICFIRVNPCSILAQLGVTTLATKPFACENKGLVMKIAVAMSGGVDSSAAAALLRDEGHELVGFTMQLWNQRRGISVDENGDPLPSRCCSLDDVYDARRVAESLGLDRKSVV